MKESLTRAIALLLVIGANLAPASAATLPGAAAVASGSAHRFFGVLVSARGTALVLRLRSGRPLVVDAAEAFSAGRVSEPLFTGKPTVVEGAFGRAGVFQATAVKRAAPHTASWAADR